MLVTTSTVDPDKIPSNWVAYLEKIKSPPEPNDLFAGRVLCNGSRQRLNGEVWRFADGVYRHSEMRKK